MFDKVGKFWLKDNGQSLVEFALILPILLLLAMLPVDFFRYIDLQMKLNNAAADGLNSLDYQIMKIGKGEEYLLNSIQQTHGGEINIFDITIEEFTMSAPKKETYTYYVYSSHKATNTNYQDRFDARPSSYEHCCISVKLSCRMEPISFWGVLFLGKDIIVTSQVYSRDIYSGGYISTP